MQELRRQVPHNSDCPAKGKECRLCKRIGHFECMCQNARPKVGSIDNEQADSQSTQTTSSNTQSSSRKPDDAEPPQETKRTLNVNVGFLGKFEEEKDGNADSDNDLWCLSIENRTSTTEQSSSTIFSEAELPETPEVDFLGAFEENSSPKQGSTENFHCITSYLPNVIKLNKRVSNLLFERDAKNNPRCIDVIVRSGLNFIKLTVDTGSPSSFVNKTTADKLVKSVNEAKYQPINEVKDYIRHIDYNDSVINVLGQLTLPVTSAGWEVEEAKFLVVEKARCLLGMDLHAPLGISTTQIWNPKKKGSPNKINSIELPNPDDWASEN